MIGPMGNDQATFTKVCEHVLEALFAPGRQGSLAHRVDPRGLAGNVGVDVKPPELNDSKLVQLVGGSGDFWVCHPSEWLSDGFSDIETHSKTQVNSEKDDLNHWIPGRDVNPVDPRDIARENLAIMTVKP